ncbi:MAG: hypothetical protein COW11_03030 [Candidatus Omnitrophica bacterium CG12_big_fil_rev_8_21_14_0_65_43_15]|uniref:DUF3800 domain-containing protein n=1 Tax=Candidatus Taenaricola geysiri TaxID=1974752 RepID=A0A2J0LLL3_9BACT|nr:MAG: hypothetical protein COS29_00550 [Candidatus Omnitrophica bacterium CG02_land_8_20_14_3_00__42_8]PIW66493.1 MAG: hypothetical protein COW11_03030 [Candidatus Omnitrophica bacterium CG12_big_fil_rev_8_21_14_0_65_43_15]PJC45994.1 MAG: hypothetical protein CO036_05135 [Candidatus Omnitrophica bacterium CG_4_9_14_0_2_um_filter_43_12]
MWFLYLDESGDLGFDFVNKKPSKFFTITILAISGIDKNRALINCVKCTINRKLYKKKNNASELKGSKTSLEVKKYFYERCKNIKCGIYALTLNKRRLYEKLSKDKERVYNYIARLVMDKIPFEKAITRVELIVDKSKSKPEIQEFNSYIMRALKGRLDPKVPLDIYHYLSHENAGLQAADMFCWGIFRKYEKNDSEWLEIYNQDKVRYEDLYLP